MVPRKPSAVSTDPNEVRRLLEKIASLREASEDFEGTIVRSVATKYATTEEIFSGAGAAKSGGRWNRPGVEAIYASLDILTATREAYQNFIVFGFPLTAIAPRVTAGAEVKLSMVLDLTNPSIRRRIGFTIKELVSENWRAIQAAGDESWSQAIGRGCLEAEFEAVIVPSAPARDGKNIVLFPQNLHADSRIRILHREQLPE